MPPGLGIAGHAGEWHPFALLLRQHRWFLCGLLVFTIVALALLLTPWISPFDPAALPCMEPMLLLAIATGMGIFGSAVSVTMIGQGLEIDADRRYLYRPR